MASAKMITSGAAVAALSWLAGPGVATAATATTTPSTSNSTQCIAPLPPGSPTYGDGTPATADRAYLNLPSSGATPTSSNSGQLAFTGGNFTKEILAGLVLIGGGGVVLYRNNRRSLALVDDGTDDTTDA